MIMASGIYLDINDQHKLVPYQQHKCQCLANFICNIDILKVGNEANRIKQKYHALQDKVICAKQRIISLETNASKPFCDITIYNDSDLKNDEETQKCIGNTDDHHTNNKQKKSSNDMVAMTKQSDIHQPSHNVDAHIPLSLNSNANDTNNQLIKASHRNNNDQHNCNCIALKKANERIKVMENQQKIHVNTIYQIQTTAVSLEHDLNKTQQFVYSLLRQQNELQQTQNDHQQIIDSLIGNKQKISLSLNHVNLQQQTQAYDHNNNHQ